ncbi:unnamed protein product [Protopolystoma xenopodis]|uniref:Uncharacterized protein n=1 Tax=Protopolystoma xenopodis TaxID=117903 RepID=A0A3S5A5U5_9PLAT|nr:unnamed protein product [Protopolystoma xenopodis]
MTVSQHVSTTSGSQFDLTSHNSRPFSSVPSASAPFAPAPELLVSTSLPFYPPNPNALISNISTVSDASLVPPRLVIDNKTTNDYGHEQLLHLASDSHFGEMVRSQSPKEPPIIWDAESLIKGSGGRLDRLELLYTLRGQHLAAAKLQIEEMRNASEKAERISKHKIILMEGKATIKWLSELSSLGNTASLLFYT